MSDIALEWDPVTFAGDLVIEDNDIALDEGLETALIRSLFEDRRAEDGDVLPDGEVYRRGWWADSTPVVEGDKVGSRLWLLARAKQTPDVLERAAEYIREATQWLLDDKVTDRQVEISDLEFPVPGRITFALTVHRPKRDSVEFRFHHTWSSQAGE